MPAESSTLRWILTGVNLLLFAFQLYSLWFMAASWAVALVWWASVLVGLGPILGGVALFATVRKPVQRVQAVINTVVAFVYALIWVWMLHGLIEGMLFPSWLG